MRHHNLLFIIILCASYNLFAKDIAIESSRTSHKQHINISQIIVSTATKLVSPALLCAYLAYLGYSWIQEKKLKSKGSSEALDLDLSPDTPPFPFSLDKPGMEYDIQPRLYTSGMPMEPLTDLHTTCHEQLPILESSVSEYKHFQEIYDNYHIGNTTRLAKRLETIHSLKNDSSYYSQSYTLSNASLAMLKHEDVDPSHFRNCYGNPLQHVIHQECIDILEHTAQLTPTSPIYDYRYALVDCADAARAYNQTGNMCSALTLTDLCWAFLDYGKAAFEGVAEGVIGAVQDLIDHPIYTLACVVAGEYVLAYQLLKVTVNLANISITYALDHEEGTHKWNQYIEPLAQLCTAIASKEFTLRDAIKTSTALATGFYAQHKMFQGLNKIYTTAQAKAVQFAQKNPLVTPETYMATPEGVILQTAIVDDIGRQKNNVSSLNSLAKKACKRERVLPKVKTYEQARNKALKIIANVDSHSAQPHLGRFGICKNKIVGTKWHGEKVILRLDYDHIKGPHINVTDYRIGKGSQGITVAIPFQGDKKTIKSLLKHLNTESNFEKAKSIFKTCGATEDLERLLRGKKR